MLTAAGISFLVAMAARLQASPIDIAGVMASESGLQCWAHNPGGAAGLIQFEPSTLKGLGYNTALDPHLNDFCKLSDVAQLAYVEKYFHPVAGKLPNVAAVYLQVFLPARLHVADDPNAVVCGSGVLDWAYKDNPSFDKAKRGWIIVQDLADAVQRATNALKGWNDLVAQVKALMAPPCPDSV
jgi:hypothetical protein